MGLVEPGSPNAHCSALEGLGAPRWDPTTLTASVGLPALLTSPEDRSLLKTEDEDFQLGNLCLNSYAGAADMPLFPGY